MLFRGIILVTILALSVITGQTKASPPKITISFPDVGDYDFTNETVSVMTNSNPEFEMLCEANYPVEWIILYDPEDDGISEETKLVETRRTVRNFSDVTSYKFSAKIRLGYKGKLFSLANFTCKHANNESRFLQTHVIMTEQKKKSSIILTISQNAPKQAHHPPDSQNCEKAVFKMFFGENDIVPCNRCETPEDGKELELDYLRCYTPIQCGSTYKHYKKGTACLEEKLMSPPICKPVKAHFNPTIVICKNYGPALAQFYFYGVFRADYDDEFALHPPLYHHWGEVDPMEMLYNHPISKKIVYTGEQVEFTCEYSRYYFSLGSWFGIENYLGIQYIQGWDIRPCDNKNEEDFKAYRNCTLNESWRGTYRATLKTSFTEVGAHKFYCLGPVWNSSDWINAFLILDVEKGEHPYIISLKPAKESEEFVVGQDNRKLVCMVGGKPIPNIIWYGPTNETTYTVSQVDEVTSELTFIEVGHKTTGSYVCTAASYLGKISKSYKIDSKSGAALSKGAIAGISITALLIAATITVVIIRMRRIIIAQQNALRLLTEDELNEFVNGNPKFLQESRNDYFNKACAIDALPYDGKYEIPIENLSIDYTAILGSGEFGTVLKGKVSASAASHYAYLTEHDNATTTSEDLQVAVKVCKKDLDVVNFKALLTEIKVMVYLGKNENIVSLVGACTNNIRTRELFIAVEYCTNGSMDNFLKTNKKNFVGVGDDSGVTSGLLGSDQFNVLTLLGWAIDIAKGIIHGDLAIRNVLLTKDLVAKVGDFGLSRQLVDSASYTKSTKCPLPWRNMAIESIGALEFSVKSDMWAFAVTLWEMFTLGDTPYPGLNYTIDFINILQRGLRLYKPPLASNAIYDYMLLCWSIKPEDRPTTADVIPVCAKEIQLFSASYSEVS